MKTIIFTERLIILLKFDVKNGIVILKKKEYQYFYGADKRKED